MTLLAACCRRPGVRTVCVSLVTLITLGLLCAAPRSFLADHDARAHATHANAHAGPAFGTDAFDARSLQAFVINGAEAYLQRKWIENQLADIGFTSYTRVNAMWLDKDDCVNATGATCQQGLTLAHANAWRRIAASTADVRGFLILEDDATFHNDFRSLFTRYASQLPADFSVAFVGQLSRVVLDHDPKSKPLSTLLQSDVAPYTTHAYIVSREGAAALANHLEYLLSRAGSPHAASPFYLNADAGVRYPFSLTALEMKIDFFMIEMHHYFFSPESSQSLSPSWFTFESTKAVPAAFGRSGVRWTKNGAMQLGHANAGRCAAGQPDFLACEAPLPRGAPCGPSSGRLPLMGTGLAFQNQCRNSPFALYAWAGEQERVTPPTCAALRARIAPTPDSDPTPADCLDEGAVAPQSPAPPPLLQARESVPPVAEGVRFSIPGTGTPAQTWDELLKSTISVAGSPWIDTTKPPAVIVAHGMPCGQPSGRCDVPFWIRPGTTDSAVLGQVIARDEYGFLWQMGLPPPETVLDAGANCGIASVLFANLYPRAQIVSIEPASNNFAALTKNAEPYAQIHPTNAALWGEHAELSVVKGSRHGRDWDNEIKSSAPADENNKGGVTGVTVPELLERHQWPRFDFVKIDIEGSEKQVFEAADLSWLDAASYVAVELHDDMQAGAHAAAFDAMAAHKTFCHTTSGEYNVWVNFAAPRMQAYCAARKESGLDCCGKAITTAR